jgi:hypothetical protein
MTGYRATSQWAEEHSIWLGAEGEVPPASASAYVRRFNAFRLGLHIVAVGLFASYAAAAASHHQWLRLALAVAFVAAIVANTWRELARRRHRT